MDKRVYPIRSRFFSNQLMKIDDHPFVEKAQQKEQVINSLAVRSNDERATSVNINENEQSKKTHKQPID